MEISTLDVELFRTLRPKLSSNSFWAHEASEPTYANLLCSYGAQLLFADFHLKPSALCTQVVASCRNMRCEMSMMVKQGRVTEQVAALGPSVNKICADVKTVMSRKELTAAMSSCPQVEELRLDVRQSFAVNTINGLLSATTPTLKSLDISVDGPGGHSETLRELSFHVEHLHHFIFFCKFSENWRFQSHRSRCVPFTAG